VTIVPGSLTTCAEPAEALRPIVVRRDHGTVTPRMRGAGSSARFEVIAEVHRMTACLGGS
jgi:hypothetical protein